MDFLPGALTFNPAAATARDAIDPDFAADVVWLDAPRHQPRPDGAEPEHARLARPAVADRPWRRAVHPPHVARPGRTRPTAVRADRRPRPVAVRRVDRGADARHAARIDEATLAGLVAALPDAWLPDDPVIGDAEAQRRAYVRYLGLRLEAPRPFVEEAERARAAA